MKISKLKINPNNPQKFDDLESLKNSIKEFPKMMALRPMVYDPKTMFVLGGNKRLICLIELGFKEIPNEWARSAKELTEEEKQRFIIQDNIQVGEWDFEILAEHWKQEDLEEWGLEYVDWNKANNLSEDDLDFNIDEFNPQGNSTEFQKVVLTFKNKEDAEMYFINKNIGIRKTAQAWQVDMTSQSI